ncbi:MAG TPA: alpha/beta fold hydrolase [Candidatus Binatia bacterium]|nr:alpha/beta fold hydrolase [Candidatus Binatia bacterium]
MVDLSGDERVRAFAFEGGTIGCLLLHGFTGTPCEMRPLGQRLAERGYTVCAPLLPGHGTRVEDLAPTTWKDWYATALASWEELTAKTSVRVVAGLSMGALLALHLAHARPAEVCAVAALAPALQLASQRSAEIALWLRWLPRRLAIVPKRNSKLPGIGRSTPAYDEIPLRSLASMIVLQRRVRSELPEITAPTLIVEGGRDDTVSQDAGAAIESALGSPIKSRIRFPMSGHILTEDVEANAVITAIESFFEAVLAGR